MTLPGFDRDWRMRLTAFTELAAMTAAGGGVVTAEQLNRGFIFEGEQIPFWNPRKGIWRPRQTASAAALSVFTAPPQPGRAPRYDDEIRSDGLFAYRYEGTNADLASNRAVRAAFAEQRPIIYIYGLMKGVYEVMFPVFVSHDDPGELTFSLAVQPADSLTPGLGVVELEVPRRYATVEAKKRLHQDRFRVMVLSAYRVQCAVCRLRHDRLLDAAHILPDRDERGRAEVSNGLCLCKIHHAAFDVGILGVAPSLDIHIRRDVLEEHDGPMLRYGLQEMNGRKINVPRTRDRRPREEYLAERYARFRAA